MSKRGCHYWLFVPVLSLLFTITPATVRAQIHPQRLKELREKYIWGSIYLTYGPICDVQKILSKPRNKVPSLQQSSISPVIVSFLNRHHADNMRDGIAFLQVNLNTLEAGFMKAQDEHGVVNRIPWNRDQVVQAADLFDRLLSGTFAFNTSYRKISDPETSIAEAWGIYQESKENETISEEKKLALAISFRVLVGKKQDELTSLVEYNPSMFTNVSTFTSQFDKSFLPAVSPIYTNTGFESQYFKNLLVLNQSLRKNILEASTNPYTNLKKLELMIAR